MTTQTTAQPQPGATTGDSPRGTGFGGLLRAEWTKFRSVRGWVIGMILAALLMVFIGVFAAANSNIGCQINGGPPSPARTACLRSRTGRVARWLTTASPSCTSR